MWSESPEFAASSRPESAQTRDDEPAARNETHVTRVQSRLVSFDRSDVLTRGKVERQVRRNLAERCAHLAVARNLVCPDQRQRRRVRGWRHGCDRSACEREIEGESEGGRGTSEQEGKCQQGTRLRWNSRTLKIRFFFSPLDHFLCSLPSSSRRSQTARTCGEALHTPVEYLPLLVLAQMLFSGAVNPPPLSPLRSKLARRILRRASSGRSGNSGCSRLPKFRIRISDLALFVNDETVPSPPLPMHTPADPLARARERRTGPLCESEGAIVAIERAASSLSFRQEVSQQLQM